MPVSRGQTEAVRIDPAPRQGVRREDIDLNVIFEYTAPNRMFTVMPESALVRRGSVAATVPLVSGRAAAGDGRAVCRAVLSAWGLGDELLDDSTLVTSELVANGAMHGAPPVWLRLALTGDDLLVEVYDGGSLTERLLGAAQALPGLSEEVHELAEGGRGLAVVHGVARRTEVSPSRLGGKVVRAFLAAV